MHVKCRGKFRKSTKRYRTSYYELQVEFSKERSEGWGDSEHRVRDYYGLTKDTCGSTKCRETETSVQMEVDLLLKGRGPLEVWWEERSLVRVDGSFVKTNSEGTRD